RLRRPISVPPYATSMIARAPSICYMEILADLNARKGLIMICRSPPVRNNPVSNRSESQLEHEKALIKAFFLPDKQERFLAFISNPKNRRKLTQDLAHFRCFNERFTSTIPWKVDPTLKLSQRHLQGIENILRLLISRGAGQTCWAISEDPDLDGKELKLEDAL